MFRKAALCLAYSQIALAFTACAMETDGAEEGELEAEREVGVLAEALTTKDVVSRAGTGARWDWDGVTAYLSTSKPDRQHGYIILDIINNNPARLSIYKARLNTFCNPTPNADNDPGEAQTTVKGKVNGNGGTFRQYMYCLTDHPYLIKGSVHLETSFSGG